MATGSTPKVLLSTSATTTGQRQHCVVNFGQGEVFQACTTFYVDVVVTGSPVFSITLVGGINEQGNGYSLNAAITGAGFNKLTNASTIAATWWQASITVSSGTGTVKVVGISAS